MVTLTIFIPVSQTRLIVDIAVFFFMAATLDASYSLLSMLIISYVNHLLNALTEKRGSACVEFL